MTARGISELTEPKGMAARLASYSSMAETFVPFPIEKGDVFFREGEPIAQSTFEELVHDVFFSPPPLLIRGLFSLRIRLGSLLKLDPPPPSGVPVWTGPGHPFAVGQRVGFMEVVAVEPDKELLLHLRSETVDAYFSILRQKPERLYFASIVKTEGVFGCIYWSLIQPFHKFVIRGWLSGCGAALRKRQSVAANA